MHTNQQPGTPAIPAGYTPVRDLGGGRLGRAVLCADQDGQQSAIRVLDVRTRDQRLQSSLVNELRAAAAVSTDPCAAAITKVWVDAVAGLCLAQEYCGGGSLDVELARGVPAPPEDVAAGGLRVVAALRYSHAAGILHGDVRPANVLRDDEGQWRLADGGVALALRRVAPGAAPAPDAGYAPRELLGWENPGPAADVYSLGATLSALLSGHPPTPGPAKEVLPAAVPRSLATLITRMLAVDPADRPALAEVDQVLRAHVPATAADLLPPLEPPRAVVPAPRPRIRPTDTDVALPVAPHRRRTLIAAAAVATVFFAGAGAVVATSGDGDSPTAPTASGTAEPAAQSAPRSGPFLGPTEQYIPRDVRVEREGTRVRVLWTIGSLPSDATRFSLVAFDPLKRGKTVTEPTSGIGVDPGPGQTKQSAWDFKAEVPQRYCVRVQTEIGPSTAVTSKSICPDAEAATKRTDRKPKRT